MFCINKCLLCFFTILPLSQTIRYGDATTKNEDEPSTNFFPKEYQRQGPPNDATVDIGGFRPSGPGLDSNYYRYVIDQQNNELNTDEIIMGKQPPPFTRPYQYYKPPTVPQPNQFGENNYISRPTPGQYGLYNPSQNPQYTQQNFYEPNSPINRPYRPYKKPDRPTPPPPIPPGQSGYPSQSSPNRPPNRPYPYRPNYPPPVGAYQYNPYPPFSAASNPYQQFAPQSPYQQLAPQTPYQQNYAGQFGEYQPFSLLQPIQNFISGLSQFGSNGPGFGSGGSPFGGAAGQFTKALEDIARNDDYQCIPKVLCMMIGSQRTQSSLPPAFTALIAALPSTSPALVFGRAAVLGFTSGSTSCDSAYPKCPRNEDDLLYYLNNHRGGFFRFFNGGAAYGDDVDYQYNPNPQHQQQSTQQQSQFGLENLQNFADAINQGGGINLSNLGSNFGSLASIFSGLMNRGGHAYVAKPPDSTTTSNTITSIVGNLLTGLVGSQFSSRKLRNSKALVDRSDNNITEERNSNSTITVEKINSIESNSTKSNTPAVDTEARIINQKLPIYANENSGNENGVQFPKPDYVRDDRRLNLNQSPSSSIIFPIDSDQSNRYGKGIQFAAGQLYRPNDLTSNDEVKFYAQKFQQYTDRPEKIKMVFPDRTGTGNLRFDNDQFEQYSQSTRYGKILTGPIRYPDEGNQNYQYNDRDRLVLHSNIGNDYFGGSNRYTNEQFNNRDRYQQQQQQNYYRPQSSYNGGNKYTGSNDASQNIYVTNSQGIIEYYINKEGKKIYV